MRKFDLGFLDETRVSFDLDLFLRGRVLVQGSSGSGKSETVKKICYATKDAVQSVIIDPEGEYAPLRAEMPFLLVGPGGEVPATLETAELVAHRLLETGVSAILDLSELGHNRREWVRRYLVALDTAPKNLRRESLHIVDEAHIFAMEAGNALDGCGMAVADIASRGRKRGIGIVVVTQRLALLSNHIIGLCENLLVGRTGLIDAPRTAKLFAKGGAEGREFIKQLGRIGDGQFYAYGRAFGMLEPTLFQVERVPGQTLAKAGKQGKRSAPPTPEQIRALLPKFADIPKEVAEKKAAEQERYDNAMARVGALEKELATKAAVPAADPEEVRKMKAQLDTLDAAVKDAQAQHAQDVRQREAAVTKLRAALTTLGGLYDSLDEVGKTLQPTPGTDAGMQHLATEAAKTRERMRGLGASSGLPAKTPAPIPIARPSTVAAVPEGESAISKPEQKVLDALGWFEDLGITEPETAAVAFIAGYKPIGGAFGAPKAALTRRGWIGSPASGKMSLTVAGRQYVQDSGIERTNAGVQRAVLDRFGESERKVLAPLLACYPAVMSSADVAQAAGYKPVGGAFGAPRAALIRAGVITSPKPGELRAADLLFPEARR